MFLLITDVSVFTPGDERSKTHPGHGYPEHTDIHKRVEEFETEAMLETRMLKLKPGESYQVYEAKRIKTSFKRTVQFERE